MATPGILDRFRIDPASWKGNTSVILAASVGVLLFVLVLVAVVASVAQGGEPHFSAYSGDADGLSSFRDSMAANHEVASIAGRAFTLREVQDPQRTLLVVAGVERAYTASERDEILAFVREGGKVLIADDFNEGNSVSLAFGWRFDNARLLDESTQGTGQADIVSATATLPGSTHTVALGRPSSLAEQGDTPPGFVARPLARSSPRSYIDIDGDGQIDAARDQNRPEGFLIMVELAHALGGRIVFVSDVEVFANDLVEDDTENARFLDALVAHLLGGGQGLLLFDESRHAHAGQAGYELLGYSVAVTRDPLLSTLLVVAALGSALILGLLLRGPEDWHHRFDASGSTPREVDDDAVRERLRLLLESTLSVRSGLGRDDVKRLDHASVVAALGDPVLADFVLGRRTAESEADLQDMINRIRSLNA